MRRIPSAFVRRLALAMIAAVLGGCNPSSRTPAGPTALGPTALPILLPAHSNNAAANVVSWSCVAGEKQLDFSAAGWTIKRDACLSPATRAASAGVEQGSGASHLRPPTNLRAAVNATTVQLTWDRIPGWTGELYQIEVGSAPSLSDVAIFQKGVTGSSLPTLSVTITGAVPGVFFVRVRWVYTTYWSYELSEPSNEVTVVVDNSCGGPLSPPFGLRAAVTGNDVSIVWSAPAGAAATSYVLEVGTESGLSNLFVFDTRNPATSLHGTAPTGVYFARVRAKNPCGTSEASNEIVVGVAMLPAAPVARFALSREGRAGGCPYASCVFNGSFSSGIGLTYFWDFGDGTIATGPYVTHSFPRPNPQTQYTVRLTVTDAFGRTSTATQVITVRLTLY
jgi:hypothetical protein